jgi:hypothetical protein
MAYDDRLLVQYCYSKHVFIGLVLIVIVGSMQYTPHLPTHPGSSQKIFFWNEIHWQSRR